MKEIDPQTKKMDSLNDIMKS